MKTLIKIAAGSVATLAINLGVVGAAQAGCSDGMYCSSGSGYGGTTSLPPLSSYFDSGSSYGGSAYGSSYGGSDYGSTYSSYSTVSYGGSMSASQADSLYGTGSISSAYSDGSYGNGGVTTYGFSGSTDFVPGLGAGESLQPTTCPVSVDNPNGGRVLGCYSVVKKVAAPVANTTYYRVVRPIVYVRYPVPVPVPYNVYSPCASRVSYSRYGGYGPQGGLGGYGGYRGCR